MRSFQKKKNVSLAQTYPRITQASILMRSHLKSGINPPPHTSAWLFGKNLHIGFPYIWQLGQKEGLQWRPPYLFGHILALIVHGFACRRWEVYLHSHNGTVGVTVVVVVRVVQWWEDCQSRSNVAPSVTDIQQVASAYYHHHHHHYCYHHHHYCPQYHHHRFNLIYLLL